MITGLMNGAAALKMLSAAKLWKQYARSMRKRRSGSELGHNSFGFYCRKSYFFVYHQSAVIGQIDESGRFCISHFAPATQREGIAALKALRTANISCVFAITEDMAGMLEKIGYSDTGLRVASSFRGTPTMKHIFIN